MAYFLYTICGYNENTVGKSLSAEGITAISQHDTNSGQSIGNASGILINTPGGTYDGYAPGAGATNRLISDPRNPFYRVNQGAGAYAGGYNYHGLVIGNTATSSPTIWGTMLDNSDKETDWKGIFGSLTWHTPSLTTDTYTLIVPTDNVVYQSLVQRVGCVLVWHIPYGELGVYGQNANLSSTSETVTASDTDDKAAGKIWYMGYGLIAQLGEELPYLQLA